MKRFCSQAEKPIDENFTSLPLSYMTKRSGKVRFGEGGTKVFLLQPIDANEEASTCGNGNDGQDEDNDNAEMKEERRLNKMRNCTQEKWHELHRSFLLTNAFSEDGRKSLL